MLVAYIDETGDTGPHGAGGSLTYGLGCVLVQGAEWASAFDEMVRFRRRLRASFGLPAQAEIKASYLVGGGGPLRNLGLAPAQRQLIYRAHLRVLADLPSRAFAVLVDKRDGRHGSHVFDLAWEGLLQRLERTSTKENLPLSIIHDDGENDAIRKWVRRARRYLTAGSAFSTGGLANPIKFLVDDPSPRRSHQSYFIQAADLVAYAAFRAHLPGGTSTAAVCPVGMWAEIGEATHTAVTALRPRSQPGIVLR